MHVQEIRQGRVGHRRDLQQDQVNPAALATLCAELGILANLLTQQQAANQEIVESPQEDEGI